MKICLAMIVKNEAHVIARAIGAVRHMIDCYAIVVDESTTDETIAVAKQALDGLPGEIITSPWAGYGPQRNKSLALAERVTGGDGYAFVVDADDVFAGPRPDLDGKHDGYVVWVIRPRMRYTSARFLRLGVGIEYLGPVHERPARNGLTVGSAEAVGVTVTSPNDGAQSGNYAEHARLLEAWLAEHPDATREQFYLGITYRNMGQYQRAVDAFHRRASMGPGDNPEEVYVALLEAGRCLLGLKRLDDAKASLLRAHAVFPQRHEAPAELAKIFAVIAVTSPPVGQLFVEPALTGSPEEEFAPEKYVEVS